MEICLPNLAEVKRNDVILFWDGFTKDYSVTQFIFSNLWYFFPIRDKWIYILSQLWQSHSYNIYMFLRLDPKDLITLKASILLWSSPTGWEPDITRYYRLLSSSQYNQEDQDYQDDPNGSQWIPIGGGGNQRTRIYREAGYMDWSCSWKKVTDQEGRPAGQRQSGAGAGNKFLVLFRLIEQDQELVKTNM